jgi:hypothetical protein
MMDTSDAQRAGDEAFVEMMRSRGIEVPGDLVKGAASVHRELSKMAALLRQSRDAESEPAQVFSLAALVR